MAFQLMRVASQPGVQRDGTTTAAQAYTDAQWCRWQRSLPRKMGGYKNTQAYLTAISRALFTQAASGQRYIVSGNPVGIDYFTIDNTGVCGGVLNPTFPATTNPTTAGLPTNSVLGQPPAQVNSWQLESMYDNASSLNLIFAHCAQNTLDPNNNGIPSGNTSIGFPLYCAAMANPSNWTQGVVTAGATITPTPRTGFAQVQGYGTGSDGFLGTQQALFPNGITGGICALEPYLTVYGNDGFVAWSAPGFPTDFTGVSQGSLYVGATRVTHQKIVRGLPLRGGGGLSPNGLYWSTDSLIRATFVGVPNGTFQFDQLTTQSSVLSANCIIEEAGVFYWAGADRFLMYNGVIQEIPNSMNLNWFYDNINQNYAGKSFCFKLPRYGEIWWCYPRGTATECSHAVIYNYREKYWYDTVLPPTGRCSGIYMDNLVGNLMCDPTPWQTNPALSVSSVATSSGGVAVYTGNFPNGGGNVYAGLTFTVAGFVAHPSNNGTFQCTASTTTTLTLANASAVAETIAATATQQPTSNYNMWEHEQGTDQINGTIINAVPSYFTTAPITSFDSDPPRDDGITLGVLQPDFVQSGDMQVQVIKQNDAKQPPYNGTLATIYANPVAELTGVQSQQIGYTTPLKDTAKIIRLQFISNVPGGNYQMGRTMLEVQSDGDRET